MRKLLTLLPLVAWLCPAQPTWKEFSIGPATRNQTGFGPQGLRAQGVTMLHAISLAYGIPETLITGPDWLATQRYAITALVAEPADFQPLFQRELAARFNLQAKREKKETLVYVLKLLEGTPHKLQSSSSPANGGTRNGSIDLPGFPFVRFASTLEDFLHRPVLNETGLSGRYDFALTWDPGNDVSLVNAVKDKLGLDLTAAKRPMDCLTIDHVERLKDEK
jgi:uncharacterized protein (TIGR03435 family)